MCKKREFKKKTSSSQQTDCKESQSSVRREEKETAKVSRSRSPRNRRDRGSPLFSSQHSTASEEPSLFEVFTSDTSSNDDIPDESQPQMMFVNHVVNDTTTRLVSTINKYKLSSKELFEHGYPIESTRYPGCAVINNVSYPSGPKIGSDSGQYSNSSSSDNSEQESSSDNEKNFDTENSRDKEKNLGKNSPENKKRSDSESSSDNEKSSGDKKSFENEKSCDSESSSDNEKSLDDRKSSENEKSCDSSSNSDSEKSLKTRNPEYKKSCSRKGSSNNKNSSDDEMCLGQKKLEKEKSCDSESSSDSEKSPDKKKKFGLGSTEIGSTKSLARTCVRCEKIFYVDETGEYLSMERCIYHCGKLYNRMTNDSWYHTCCNQARFSRGCAEWKTHVWTGLVPGINGPFADYVRPMPCPMFLHDNYGVYAMDCEMCFTLQGLELARVTLVNLYGVVVYDTLVKPSSEIIDYNTKFSGITEEDMRNVTKTLPEVQNDLLQNFIFAETILMGHGLGNDLRALRLIHENVVDTSVMFPHYLGLPYRNGLKTLARKVLNRKIQEETHNSVEDAQVVVDLVVRKAQHEWQASLAW